MYNIYAYICVCTHKHTWSKRECILFCASFQETMHCRNRCIDYIWIQGGEYAQDALSS